MNLTEQEAATKWCHRASPPPGLRHVSEQNIMCIGAACMAWRWSRGKETQAYLDAVQARMKETGENFNVATNKVFSELGATFEQTEGFCGLAGKP